MSYILEEFTFSNQLQNMHRELLWLKGFEPFLQEFLSFHYLAILELPQNELMPYKMLHISKEPMIHPHLYICFLPDSRSTRLLIRMQNTLLQCENTRSQQSLTRKSGIHLALGEYLNGKLLFNN